MISYPNEVILDNTINTVGTQYRIVKTETVFRFAPAYNNFVNRNFDSTEPLKWIYDDRSEPGILKDKNQESSRSLKHTLAITPLQPGTRKNKATKELGKKHKKRKTKLKKCILKVFKKEKKRNKHKKFMVTVLLGLLAAKSLLLPVVLKALAFISVKGLMMGFFSTMLASVFSVRSMIEHSHAYNRRDDTKTQVEIIQVPSKSDEHVHYDQYKRSDHIPLY